jgi:glycosyltransferase involved in cell wall biosynthesis
LYRFLFKLSHWLIYGFAQTLRKIIPAEIWLAIKSLLFSQTINKTIWKIHTKEWQKAREKSPWRTSSQEFKEGINLVGYFRTAKGISEAARSSALALTSAKIPYTINDYEFDIPAKQQVDRLPHSQYGNGFKFNTNLIHINPPQLPFLWNSFAQSDLIGRYNIGVWYWELPELPNDWRPAFGIVDEVWVATQFIYDSISAKSPIPVVKIPPCIHPIYNQQLNKKDFNLPDDRFLFMCAYDVLSTQARKNPIGAVNAFKKAFSENDVSVGLVIKVNNVSENPQEVKLLSEHINGYSNCYIIEEVFDKPKFNSLLNVVDAYVSLHRSEGFGLIPAEAMSLGVPVIMTRWSGNVDFMTSNNCCGVDYELIPVGEQAGPYMSGQLWANPDIDHASYFMQKLVSDKKYYDKISMQARQTIQDGFSPYHIGQLIRKRMGEIGLVS